MTVRNCLVVILALTGAPACQKAAADDAARSKQASVGAVAQRETPAPQTSQWYAADVNFTHCIPSRSPASRIEEIRHAGLEPTTKDLNGPNGDFVGVEVTAPKGDLEEQVWTYYNSEAGCASALARETAIPAKYGAADDNGDAKPQSVSDDAKWEALDAAMKAKADAPGSSAG